MNPEDIDDLFKGKLEGHSSDLPSPLWNRLEERMQQQQAKPGHPVDALFRQKLQNHGTQLPASLWSRIEERMHPEKVRTRPMWVWYAAASIMLLLSVIGYRQINFVNTTPNLATAQRPTVIPKETELSETETNTKNTSDPSPDIFKQELAAADNNQAFLASDRDNLTGKSGRLAKQEIRPAGNKNKAVKEQKTLPKNPVQAHEENLLAVHTPAKPENKGAIPEELPVKTGQTENITSQPAFAKPVNVEIILASAAPQTETVASETEEENPVKTKALFAKKVAKQLWNIKKGETPDLQEFGLAQNYSSEVKNKIQTLSKTINL